MPRTCKKCLQVAGNGTRFTAAQTVLLAAADLAGDGYQEFSEWELTVAAWKRDPVRFGLQGFARLYPDHKRVMTEVMSREPNKLVPRKLIEKIRPNYYYLTSLGRAVAEQLLGGEPLKLEPIKRAKVKKLAAVEELHSFIATVIARPEFRRWQDNPEEPRDWAGTARFLALSETELEPVDRLTEVRDAVKAAIDWCNDQEVTRLTGVAGVDPIHVRELSELFDFLQALEYRFPKQLKRK